MMLVGAITLWVGVPLGWLWIGSQLQAGTGSLGVALGAMMAGMVVTAAIVAWWLGWLGRKHVQLQELRGDEPPAATALEQVLVLSAVVAVVAFAVWFFGFSGSEPLPLNISY
jgi:hypothetical protein